jgi:hypothetical protein
MHVRGHSGDAAGKNLAAFGDEFLEEIGVLVINRFDCDVDSAPRHGSIGAAKSGTTFGGFWLHRAIIWFRDEVYAVLGKDYTFSFPAGLAFAGFSCFEKTYNAKPVCRALSLRCIPV